MKKRIISLALVLIMMFTLVPTMALAAESTDSNTEAVVSTDTKSLSKPASVTATSSYTTVKLKWGEVSGADGYYVYQATSKSGTYKKVATVSTNSATLKSKTLGKTYYYKIKAYNGDQKSSYSSIVSVKILPKAPVIDTTVSSTSSTIKISWSEISHASGYYVYRKTADGSWSKIAKVKGKTNTSYKDTGVSGKYYYAVVAYKTVDGTTYKSVKSDSIKTRTLKKTSAISVDQYDSSLKVKVSWNNVSGATKYQVSYKAGSNDWKSLGYVTDLSKNKTQTHGVKYQYRVRAVYESGGVKTYGQYYTWDTSFVISYEPEFEVGIAYPDSATTTDGVIIAIANNGSEKMRIYSKNSYLKNSEKQKYDFKLVDYSALEKGTYKYVSYVDIPAGKTAYVAFYAGDSTVVKYKDTSILYYDFKYDGSKFQSEVYANDDQPLWKQY